MDVSSGERFSLGKYLLVRIVRLLRVCFLPHPRRERDPSADLLLGGIVHDLSIGFRVLVPARFGERSGLWIDGDTLPSPFLVFLPKRFDGLLWNAKDGLDWRDESDRLVMFIFFIIVLSPVIVGAIDYLLQAPPLQGLIPVSTAPP